MGEFKLKTHQILGQQIRNPANPMQKPNRKLSDFTCNSPRSTLNSPQLDPTIFPHPYPYPHPHPSPKQLLSNNNSTKTHKSKYSNCSKLTHSELFNKLLKTNQHEQNQVILKERDVQIQILESSLEGVQKASLGIVLKMGEMFGVWAGIAGDIGQEVWGV